MQLYRTIMCYQTMFHRHVNAEEQDPRDAKRRVRIDTARHGELGEILRSAFAAEMEARDPDGDVEDLLERLK